MIHYFPYLLCCTMGTDKMANIVHLLLIWTGLFTSCFSVEYYCPKGAKIDRDGLRCYWMPTFTSTWPEARGICQRENEGDLAMVDSVTVQTFIQNSFQMEASFWVWLRNGMKQALFDDLDAITFQPGDRAMKLCTSMALATGQWMNEKCDSGNFIICQKRISVSLPSLESYITGVPLMSAIYTVSQIQLLPSPPDPGQRRVEVMLFPGLWFSHEGQVISFDLVAQPSDQVTFARVQILRPYCSLTHHLVPPGCSSLLNAFSCCTLMPMCNTTGACASGLYWCHLLEICLPVTSPCSPYHSSNNGRVFPLPPRYPATSPFFHLMADMALKLEPSVDHTYISVTTQDKDITVYPDDILAVQHNRRAGEFLHCVASTSSAWRQSYLSLHGPEWGGWLEGVLSAQSGEGQWLDGVVCDIRVIYEDIMSHYGIPTIPSTMETTVQTNGPIKAHSPVTGLQLLHPKLDKNNQMHVAVNAPTLIVIKVTSGEIATSSWSAPVDKNKVLFHSFCPAEMPETKVVCVRSPDTWFSHVYMVLSGEGEHLLNITASNSNNFQTLSVRVVGHIPVTGLSIQPQGVSRVLVDVPQLFTASVATGSSVNFSWVIDDLAQFPHTGDSYSVVFKKPAEYKLKLIGRNPVSSQLIEVKITADLMTPLADLAVISMPEAIAVDISSVYTIRVKADISIGVTISWDFGDNTTSVSHTVSAATQMKDSHEHQIVKHIYLQDSAHHAYSFQGDYTLKIKACNEYDHIEKAVFVKVRAPLSRLLVSSSPNVCQVNSTILFDVSLWPSSYGVLYSWNFGDDSKEVKEYNSKVRHVFKRPCSYNVTVCANNTLSVLCNYTDVEIVESVSGLWLNYTSSIELNSIFEIIGKVSSGTSLKWTFEFGDGSVFKDYSECSVSYIYKSPGNYTVHVTAYNSVSKEQQSVNVEVFKLCISNILPSGCIASVTDIDFEVLVKGFIPILTFNWDFGDGSPTSFVKGTATVTHTFLTSGTFTVGVNARSPVGSVYYQTSICVEGRITDVELQSAKSTVAVSEEICFDVSVTPKEGDYMFWWNNNFSSDAPVIGLSHHCFVFSADGLYEISVQSGNKVSNKTAKMTIFVQRPIFDLSIEYEGNHVAFSVNQSYYFWAKFSGRIDDFQWDFGDGSLNMVGRNQSHIFHFPGRFHVTVTASNAVSSYSVDVVVQAPLTYLTVNTSRPFAEAGTEILINAQTDIIDNVKFHWTVNSLSPPTLGTSEFLYVFPKAGVFQVQVTAQNLVSLLETKFDIEVIERIHEVQIRCKGLQSAKYFLTNQTVVLTASVAHGSNLTYEWLTHQSGVYKTASNSKQFELLTNNPGDIHVKVLVSNVIGSVDSELSLRAVEFVSGVNISSPVNVLTKDKPVRISVSVASGTDLQFSWFLDSEHSPVISDVPFILHTFNVIGVIKLKVSVLNMFGSADATKLLSVQERISEVDFTINEQSKPFFVTSHSLLFLRGFAKTGNVLHWEWAFTFSNNTVVFLSDNQTVSYSSVDVADHHVSLNASNDISWQIVSYTVMVRDAIQGLLLSISSSVVCENDPVTFIPSVSHGSEVSFTLEFVNESSSMDIQQNFTTSVLSVGNHLVRAKAKNKVSEQTATVTVQVVDKIKDLHLIGCCSAVLEASKNITFQAVENSTSQVNYHWTFLINGVFSSQEIGRNVHFTPITNGSLSITLKADNGFCSQSLSITATVQKHVREVKLLSSHDGAFIDYPIHFLAITDGGSDLKFIWEFGEPSGGTLVTESNTQDHKYNVTGRFVVHLTAFNSVSRISTQISVEVQNLECTQPHIYLVEELSQIVKSRSSLFEARVDLKGCITRKALYQWEIFKGPNCSAMVKITVNDSVDVTTPLLFLPKHGLKVGNYCLTFTTRLQGTPLNHHKTINITVVHGQLVPMIKGGSHRIWSSQKDLLLDATDSYDPDSEEADNLFRFHWDNTIENTTTSSLISSTFHQPIPKNGSILLIPRSALFPGIVYHFTLNLYKDGRRPVSASQTVTVYDIAVLPVAVNCTSCYSRLSFHVNPSRNVALSGHCSSCKDTVQYTWGAENQRGEALLLNEGTTSTGQHSKHLVIRPGVLMEGHEYTFTLNVSEPSGLWGSASITLIPNRPPYGGICTLSPDDSLHFLETLASYNCSGWMDDDGESAQLIFSLHVSQCEDFGPLCPLLTLYRGTQSMFGSLVPMGSVSKMENRSAIHMLVKVEDNMGASVIAVRKSLTVLLSERLSTEWLRNRSQSEFRALLQQGNPQDIIQYSVALTSQLNQLKTISAQELEDKIQIRGTVTRALASLPVSSIQDAAQISSALAQSTAIPSEVRCESCHAKVLKVTEKMIKVMREQTGQSDIDPTDTGRNILSVLSSTLTADHSHRSHSGLKPSHTSETDASALSQILELMRSLMMFRMGGEEALSLAVPKISAVGVRGDPTKDLLCADPFGSCQFYVPLALSSQLKEENQEVLQIFLEMAADENPFIPDAELPLSTTLAAMEFATAQGQPIPIANLTSDTAIQFTLHKKRRETEDERLLGKKFTLPTKGSVNFTVKAVETDPQAGLYVSLNFSLIPGPSKTASGLVWISVTDQSDHSSRRVHSKAVTISLSSETSSLEHTIFLTPLLNGSAKDLFVNLTSSIDTDVSISALVFSALCRFFSVAEKRWSSEGLRPLSNSSPHAARCLTQHLTMFGASLFVHPETLLLLPPSEEPVKNVMVGIVCGVLLLIHLLVGLISHKLDHLESLRLSCVPLCGQKGRYQYRIMVKTGWKRGSGTTAHVGISLHGLNKSGSRHLQREGAFQRNSLDDFQIETDANLGEIWKIRIWHDNTGLDPSWYLQHVIVWDLQTENMFFFLVEDWLSVENERNSGRVEKVVLASCPQELQQFRRVLQAQLLFGLREHHLWISLWERPAHSSFSRAQRVTCCCLLLHLYLAAGAVWYGAVGRKGSGVPVSSHMLMNAETILVGMTVAALMFPLQTVLRLLFQKTKSKVTLELSLPPSPVSHTVEMDVFLNGPDFSCSSFLSLPTGPDSSVYDGPSPFTNSLQSNNLDSEFWKGSDHSDDRLDHWASCDSIFGLSELPGANLLKRKKALLQLHLSTPTSDHDTLEPTKSPEEDLRSLSGDMDPTNTLSSEPAASDSGHFTPNESTLSEDQDSLCSDWSDLSLDTPTYETDFHKSCATLSVLSDASTFLPSLPPDSISTTSNTRIGVVRGFPASSLPAWVLRVVHLLVAVLLGTCLALVGLYGSRFSSSVVLMWLVSALSAFLTSSLLLEPFAICVQALYLAAVVRPVDPEVEERLAQETEVRRTEDDVGDKVHPPSGYGLLQAKEEARKLKKLRVLMRNCLVYMLFLLVVLMVNYQENVQETSSRLLRSAIKHTLISASPGQPSLNALSGWMNAEQWIDKKLTSHLYKNPSLSLIGLPRLQKMYSQDFCSQNIRDLFQSGRHPLMLASHFSSHANPGHHRSSGSIRNTPALLTRSSKDVLCTSDQTEKVLLGNSSESARQILSELQTSNWMTTGTQAALIEFTQYHKETSILAPVSILLDQKQTGRIFAFISIQPFHVTPFSAADLHVTLTVLLLLFGLCFLGAEIWTLMRKPHHYLRQTCCWFQLLLAFLTLAAAVLRLYFLSTAESCLSRHRLQPDSFTDFQSAASLARKSSQLSAVLLTLLVLKMVGVLRFVRRWLVLGRVIRQVFPQICTVALLLLLLLLLFSHTGIMLFSSSVEGFRTLGQASHSLLCLLRGHNSLHRLFEQHPLVGPLYCLCAVGVAFWVVGRLCAAVLIKTYRMVQADINRPPIEPQDYEMVQFLIKRLKLWMGLSKTKEFRHRVKFEGMVPPPSRSSQDSQASNFSSPMGPRQASPASMSSDFTVNSDSLDFHHYVDRLVPVVNSDSLDFHHYVDRLVPVVDSLLACFDRVNQVTEEVYNFELQLEEVQKRITQRKQPQQVTTKRCTPTPKLPLHAQTPSTSFLECNSSPPSVQGISKALPHRRGTHSESSFLGPSFRFSKRILSALDGRKNSANSGNGGVPRRRAWNSMTCHSADTAQRLPGSQRVVILPVRPRSEEGDRELVQHGVPIKRQAWHSE